MQATSGRLNFKRARAERAAAFVRRAKGYFGIINTGYTTQLIC